MWMTKLKYTRVSGKLFHKHKYITNPDVTPEDRVKSAMSKMSQKISDRACNNHLSDTTLDQPTGLGEILKKRIKDKEEQDQKTHQSISQTIRRSARIDAGNGLPVPRKLSKPTLLFRPPSAAAAPPRVPTTAAPITYFGSDLPKATPPRVQPPQRSPRLAEQAAKFAVTDEILREKAATQKYGPAQRTRSRTCSIAQEAMLDCAKVMQLPMYPQKLAQRKYPSEMINAVLNQVTG